MGKNSLKITSENELQTNTKAVPSPAPTKQSETKYVAECNMPSLNGIFRMRGYTYKSAAQSLEPVAMVAGDVRGKENVLVRVHDQCFTSEVFGSMRCDCREQLQQSLRAIHKEGGVIIYLQQEGRGIGLANKIAAYSLQDEGFDTVTANEHLGFKDELREYDAVPEVLADLGIQSIRLITNNPFKINQLTALGVNIVERVSIEIPPNPYNIDYLVSKRDKMAHMLTSDLVMPSENSEVDGRPVYCLLSSRPEPSREDCKITKREKEGKANISYPEVFFLGLSSFLFATFFLVNLLSFQ